MGKDSSESEDTDRLLCRVSAGDRQAFDQLFSRHRSYLRRMIDMRLDSRLRSRVDASDVVQETQLEAFERLDDYLARKQMPFRLWLRKTAHERLCKIRERHIEAGRRAVAREMRLPDRSSFELAQQLLAGGSSPSQKLVRQEAVQSVRRAMAQLPPLDREILLMRNFEGLSNQEVAYVLDLDPATASKRLGRALLRLRKLLVDSGLTESQL